MEIKTNAFSSQNSNCEKLKVLRQVVYCIKDPPFEFFHLVGGCFIETLLYILEEAGMGGGSSLALNQRSHPVQQLSAAACRAQAGALTS